ncbi:hypothetical protein INT47_007734 [Mucor saturninus]|uniref:Uncharacterized protein n=1 Tax=Mucor saturninus TaxID=64648 RepID=A0A8H7QWL2_9FUNG|nr:hypothetical protein INT47_007734 [Mucor saturninus]
MAVLYGIIKNNWETDVLSPGHIEYAAVDAYLRDILPDESNLSKREQLITPKNKSSIGMEIVKVSIPGILLDRYKDNLSLEDFGQPNFTISVNRANLLTASEPKYISSLV